MGTFGTLKLALATALFGLVIGPQSATAQSGVDGDWQVGSAAGAPRLTFAGAEVRGHSGCRNFSGVIGDNGRVRLDPAKGRCASAAGQRTENRFLAQLRAARSFKLRGGKLEARGAKGERLFLAARLTAPAADTRIVPGPIAAGGGLNHAGSWRPAMLDGKALPPLGGSVQTIRISGLGSGWRLQIEGHCNSYAGTVAFGNAGDSKGSFGVFLSDQTQQMCADARFEMTDAALLAALEAAKSYVRSGNELRLFDASGKNVAVIRLM
jgi:heat shock protein HslJ